jgi:hypothetical protein
MPRQKKSHTPKRLADNKNGRAVQALRQHVRKLERERDTYRKALLRLLPKERIRLTKQDIREMDASGLTLDNVLEQLKRI